MNDSFDDILESLLERLRAMPGGDYYATMLRNNPEFIASIKNIDPADPAAAEHAMQAAMSALGIDSGILHTVRGMVEKLQKSGFDFNNASPADLMRAMGADPSILGAFGNHHGPLHAHPPTTSAPSAPVSTNVVEAASGRRGVIEGAGASGMAQPSVTTTKERPSWENAAQEASRLIAAGNERRGFEILTAALDDDSATSYDPSDFARFAGLSGLLEVFAAEASAAGRQVPLRFASLFQRYALFVGFAQIAPPASNPEFTTWCAAIVDHATRR